MTNGQMLAPTRIRRTFYSLGLILSLSNIRFHLREILEVNCKLILEELHVLDNVLVGELALRQVTSKGE
jgi:hypothetical protein